MSFWVYQSWHSSRPLLQAAYVVILIHPSNIRFKVCRLSRVSNPLSDRSRILEPFDQGTTLYCTFRNKITKITLTSAIVYIKNKYQYQFKFLIYIFICSNGTSVQRNDTTKLSNKFCFDFISRKVSQKNIESIFSRKVLSNWPKLFASI